MEWWHVYLFTRLNGINSFFTLLMILLSIVFSGCVIGLFVSWADDDEKGMSVTKRMVKAIVLPWLIISFIHISIPTQKEAAAIWLIPKIANSEAAKEAAKLPEGMVNILRLKMEEWIDDITQKKK